VHVRFTCNETAHAWSRDSWSEFSSSTSTTESFFVKEVIRGYSLENSPTFPWMGFNDTLCLRMFIRMSKKFDSIRFICSRIAKFQLNIKEWRKRRKYLKLLWVAPQTKSYRMKRWRRQSSNNSTKRKRIRGVALGFLTSPARRMTR